MDANKMFFEELAELMDKYGVDIYISECDDEYELYFEGPDVGKCFHGGMFNSDDLLE